MADAGWKPRVEVPLDALTDEDVVRRLVNASPEIRWTAYVLGVFYLFLQRWPDRVAIGNHCLYRIERSSEQGSQLIGSRRGGDDESLRRLRMESS